MENLTHEQEAKLQKLMKDTLIEWCQDTTSHGCLNIVKANNILLRLIWIVCLLASIGFCFYMIFQTMASYVSNPIATSITIVNEIPAVFPTVSMCFLNPLATDEAVYAEIDALMRGQPQYLTRPLSLQQITSTRRISYYMSQMNDTRKKQLGNTIENSVFFCKFNSRPCEDYDLEWYYDFTLGNCYKFNAYGNKTVGKGGFLPSLQMTFVIGDSTTRYDYYQDIGMRILIHNSSLAAPIVSEDGISLAPGFNYDLKVSRTYYSRLPAPYSECLKDATNRTPTRTYMMNVMFDSLQIPNYNKRYCENLLFQQVLDTNCSCVDPAYKYRNNTMARCITERQFLCQDGMFRAVYGNPSFYFSKECPEGKIFKINLSFSFFLFLFNNLSYFYVSRM